MADFGPWLRRGVEPEFQDLRNFARDQGADWPYESNTLQPYIDRVNAAQPQNAPALLTALGRAFERWTNSAVPEDRSFVGLVRSMLPTPGGIAFFGFGIFVGWLVYHSLTPEFIQLMERIEGARGLITFFFSFTTMAVVILVIISIFWIDAKEVDTRFAKAKDVLTILIGVLGTIMGFYFGSAVDRPALTFTKLKLNPAVAISGAKVALTGQIGGGTVPYNYTITFSDPSMTPIEGRSETGDIAAQITAPNVNQASKIMAIVSARDNKSIVGSSKTPLELQVNPASPGQPAGRSGPPPTTLTLGDLQLSAPRAKPTDKVTVQTTISGGTGPYTYSVTQSDSSGANVKNLVTDKSSPDGKIVEELSLSDAKPPSVRVIAIAKDQKKDEVKKESSLTID